MCRCISNLKSTVQNVEIEREGEKCWRTKGDYETKEWKREREREVVKLSKKLVETCSNPNIKKMPK